MRRYQHSQTAYCRNPDCANETGFEVPWAPDTGPSYASGGEWGYPLIDECPACKAPYSDEPIDWETPIEGLLDELLQAGAISHYDDQTDRKALYKAVLAELRRQARERFNERYELHKRCEQYDIEWTAAELRALEMGLPF